MNSLLALKSSKQEKGRSAVIEGGPLRVYEGWFHGASNAVSGVPKRVWTTVSFPQIWKKLRV